MVPGWQSGGGGNRGPTSFGGCYRCVAGENGGAGGVAQREWSGCPTAGVFCCSPFKRWKAGVVTALFLMTKRSSRSVGWGSCSVAADPRRRRGQVGGSVCSPRHRGSRSVSKCPDAWPEEGPRNGDRLREILEEGAHSDWREDVEHFAIHRVDRVSLEELALPDQPLLASLRLLRTVSPFSFRGKAPLRAPSRQRYNGGACGSRSG